MKISHEVPISLLEMSKTFNDYDYCLAPFLGKYPQYNSYFLSNKDRMCIMDNGLHENYLLSNADLVKHINEIEPDIFIVPDVWNDRHLTYSNAKEWMKEIKPLISPKTELMVVIQATTFTDAYTLYIDLKALGYKHIAFNYSSKMYATLFPHLNQNVSRMMGRILFINKLLELNILDKSIYHHLLGASDWTEFKYYNSPGYEFIKSVDTSSPIVHAAKGINYEYNKSYEKPTELIENFIFNSDIDEKILLSNINIFKNQI